MIDSAVTCKALPRYQIPILVLALSYLYFYFFNVGFGRRLNAS